MQKPEATIQPELARSAALIPPLLRESIAGCVRGLEPWPLLVTGAAGVGKTRAALLLCDCVRGSMFYTAASLCEELIDSQKGRLTIKGEQGPCTIHPEMFWGRISRATLVVVDDLGSRSEVSDFHYETIKRLLDTREQKPTMFTSNFELSRLTKLYDARVASRLTAGTVLLVEGEDQRRKR